MVTYVPVYYSSLHDTITSLCKNIVPFSFKKRRLPGLTSDQKLSKQQSENLKWQQESFHRILNLIGLQKEGILPESEVLAFRAHVLDTILASPVDQEHPTIIRDKLLFLQELFYAKCISVDEYHSSKRPLSQRLAVQGVSIETRDVAEPMDSSEKEWPIVEFKEEQCLMDKSLHSKIKQKHKSPLKKIKVAASIVSFVTPYKTRKPKGIRGTENLSKEPLEHFGLNIPSTTSIANDFGPFRENPFWDMPSKERERETCSILKSERSPMEPIKVEKERSSSYKVKQKPFSTLFQREQREENGNDRVPDSEQRVEKSAKKQWGFDGFKTGNRYNPEDETTPLSLGERSDYQASSTPCYLVDNPTGECPDAKLIKKKIHTERSASDFYTEKVLGENINKDLPRIQTELCTTKPKLHFSNNRIEAISTKLPVEKANFEKNLPMSCDRYEDNMRKEFKDHVGGKEESLQKQATERNGNSRWVTFEDNNQNSDPGKHGNSRWVTFEDNNENSDPGKHGNSRWVTFEENENSHPEKHGNSRWVTFEDNNENSHPNLCVHRDQLSLLPNSKEDCYFYTNCGGETEGNKLRTESSFFQDQNPFWTPKQRLIYD